MGSEKNLFRQVGFFGDSNTKGFKPTLDNTGNFPDDYEFYESAAIWPNQIILPYHTTIIDGQCGRTMGNWRKFPSRVLGDTNSNLALERLLTTCPDLTYLIISLGTNDFDKLSKNSDEVMRSVEGIESMIVEMTSLHLVRDLLWVLPNFYSPSRTRLQSDQIDSFTYQMIDSTRNTVDLRSVIVDSVDGIHFTPRNHHEVAQLVNTSIKSPLKPVQNPSLTKNF